MEANKKKNKHLLIRWFNIQLGVILFSVYFGKFEI